MKESQSIFLIKLLKLKSTNESLKHSKKFFKELELDLEAIKDFKEIKLSAPSPNQLLNENNIPELYKLLLTISILIKDYDEDLFKLVCDKWEKIPKEEKDKFLELINANLSVSVSDENTVSYSGEC